MSEAYLAELGLDSCFPELGSIFNVSMLSTEYLFFAFTLSRV
jgi:hypothetical protein